MSMQEVRRLMSADYRKYVLDIVSKYPAQVANLEHYQAFEACAELGSMACKVRLKGRAIDKGRVVLYVPSEREGFVTVWWQGCMCPASVKASAVKAL